MKNPFKDFLYFSRGERRGILVLIIGIIVIFLSGYIYSFQQNNRALSDKEIQLQVAALREYDHFINSMREQDKTFTAISTNSPNIKKRQLYWPLLILTMQTPLLSAGWVSPHGWQKHTALPEQRREVSQNGGLQKGIRTDRRTISCISPLHLFYSRRYHKENSLPISPCSTPKRQHL